MFKTYTEADGRYSTEITERRITMEAQANDATVYMQIPERTPLSGGEPCLQLTVVTDGARSEIELNARGVDALADAIHQLREGNDD
jgi:hypothetical protein